MKYMLRLSMLLTALTFFFAAPSCEAKLYTSMSEGFTLDIPDSFDIQTPPYGNPNIAVQAVDPSDRAQVTVIVTRDKDADFRKEDVTGKILASNKEDLKRLLLKKKVNLIADGTFPVAPDHDAMYVRFTKSFKDVTFEQLMVQMWAHKKQYTLIYRGRIEAGRGDDFLKSAQSLTCTLK